ncbi:MAG: hypothetical protein AVDCRST_MAG32-73, partial [uncultured Nocardioides sp.]
GKPRSRGTGRPGHRRRQRSRPCRLPRPGPARCDGAGRGHRRPGGRADDQAGSV